MNEVFSFVDATHLISKAALWQERDKAIKAKYEKLNNEVLPKVAADKRARVLFMRTKGIALSTLNVQQHIMIVF